MNVKNKNIFVNRRGHKRAVDMSDEMEALEAHKTTDKSKKPTKKTVKKPLKRWQKIIIVVLIALLVCGPIILGEALRFAYDNSAQSATDDLEQLVLSKVMVIQKSDDLNPDQLQELADDVKNIRDRTCAGGMVDNAASLYPRAKTAHEKCLEVRRKFANLTAPLQDIATQLSYLDKLRPIIEAVAVGNEDQYAVISSQQENWKNTNGRLEDLIPPTSFIEIHASLTEQSNKIAGLWTKISQAYDVKDTVAFQNTESELGNAYEDFRIHSIKFKATIADTQAKITKAYSATQ